MFVNEAFVVSCSGIFEHSRIYEFLREYLVALCSSSRVTYENKQQNHVHIHVEAVLTKVFAFEKELHTDHSCSAVQ